MDDLEEVMLGVKEDHVDTFVFEDGFVEADKVWVREFGTERDFTDRGLGDAGVGGGDVFFVGFKSEHRALAR